MASKALLAACALTLGVGWALPSYAQVVSELQAVPGPTRFFIIPRAGILPVGEAVTSADLHISMTAPAQVTPGIGVPAPSAPGLGLGFGYAGNSLSLTNQMAMGDLFQMDTGITAYATTPWQGRLDLAGKMGLMQEKLGALASLAGVAGVALNVNANGTPTLGFTLGVPIEKSIGFTSMNRLTLTAYPNWGSGLVAPGTIGAGLIPPTRFAVGLGGALTLTDSLALLADTSLLTGGPTMATEGTNLGVRFGFSPNVTFDLFASLGANAPVGTPPLAVGAGLNWQY